MNAFKTLATAAIIAGSADASLTACTAADASVAIKAAFQGMQHTSTTTTTECFYKLNGVVEQYSNVATQWYWENVTLDGFLNPLYAVIDAANSTVDVFVYCDTTNLAKQFSTRFSTWSGLLDMTFTIGMSFIKNYANSVDGTITTSNLYDSANTFASSTNCVQTARAFGEMIKYTVFFEVEEANYESELSTDLYSH